MNTQTQDYIILKPIAERFKKVADKITDDDIKWLIKDELREQIRTQVNLGNYVDEIVAEFFEQENMKERIWKLIEENIKEKFKE